MIEQKAKVVAVDEQKIWLDAERQSTCSSCSVKNGCGTGLLEKHVGKKFSRIAVDKTESVVAGQAVDVLIPEEKLLEGTFIVYIVPLLMLFLLSALMRFAEMSPVMEIIGGVAGLILGLFLVKLYLKNKKIDLKVKVARGTL
jgi:sigma-E factor negative regulatory protein RseC